MTLLLAGSRPALCEPRTARETIPPGAPSMTHSGGSPRRRSVPFITTCMVRECQKVPLDEQGETRDDAWRPIKAAFWGEPSERFVGRKPILEDSPNHCRFHVQAPPLLSPFLVIQHPSLDLAEDQSSRGSLHPQPAATNCWPCTHRITTVQLVYSPTDNPIPRGLSSALHSLWTLRNDASLGAHRR